MLNSSCFAALTQAKYSGNQTGFIQPLSFMPPAPNTSADEGYLWSLFFSVQLNPFSHAASLLINCETDTLSQGHIPSVELQNTDMQQNTLGPQHGPCLCAEVLLDGLSGPFPPDGLMMTTDEHNSINLHFGSSRSFQIK